MMLVYVVTASASAICAAPTIATSPLVTPPPLAAANDGINRSTADALARIPALAAAVLPRNRLRSVPGSCCSTDIWESPFGEIEWLMSVIRREPDVGSPPGKELGRRLTALAWAEALLASRPGAGPMLR